MLKSVVMKKEEKEVLYGDIPPTKLRNIKEKFRKPCNSRFWHVIGDLFLYNMLENRFRTMMVSNAESFETKANHNYPTIFYAPHGNWWDGIVGYNMMRRAFHVKTRMMIEEMNRFPLFCKIGAFPVNKKSAIEAMKSLKFIVDDLAKDPGLGLWIFPQGIIKPPNYRPIEFQTGMAYIAQKTAIKCGGINLVPVAVNYVFLREDRPEVIVKVADPIVLEREEAKKIDRHEYTKKLEHDFTEFCDGQLKDVYTGNLDDYSYLFKRRLHWYRRLEKRLKHIEIKGSGI